MLERHGFLLNTISHPQRTKIRIPILHFLILKSNLSYYNAYEAWADSIKGNIDDVTILTKNKLEIFQISIFKQILGMSRKTTNLAILLDLGRYPISTYMHYQAIKYFSRLSSINSERLLYEAYNLKKQKLQTGETGFLIILLMS